MPVLVIDFYEGRGFKPTRSFADYDFHFSAVDKLLIGSPEEKSSTLYHRIRVGISNERFRTWDRGEYHNNDSWLKIPYEFAKRYVSEKIAKGELLEYEELDITIEDWPQAACPYDPERIPSKGQWHFEVNITKKALERNLILLRKSKEGVKMPTRQKTTIKFETVFDTYTAQGVIGQGGSGTVYEVKDQVGNAYAVKALDPSKVSREKLKRFKNECSFCSKNQHPNIITVVDQGLRVDGETRIPFFVMPKYDSTLRKLMQARIKSQDVLPLFGQILNGVEAAHMLKAIHRDLKPENILVDSHKKLLVLADFGIAHFAEEDLLTSIETAPQTRLANFQYAAPEQRKQGVPVDHRADIYALGLILNEMFTGEVPQGTGYLTIGSTYQEFGYLDEIIAKMIRQSPDERPTSIAEIKRHLIARKNEFINQQKLSELRNTVVPSYEIDDPLIDDPPRLVDFDWDGQFLTLELSRPVNETWKWAFLHMGSYSSVHGKGPETFKVNGSTLSIGADERVIQDIINHFKRWLPVINSGYERKVKQDQQEKEVQAKRKLQQEIEQMERLEKIKKSIRI